MAPVEFYCNRNAVYIRDGVTLVSLPQWNFIYIRDTVVFVELLLTSSSHGVSARTSQWRFVVRHSTKVSPMTRNAYCICKVKLPTYSHAATKGRGVQLVIILDLGTR
jgi:hypothetical protein